MANKQQILTKKNYQRDALREWKRLSQDAYHSLEFDTTMLFLRKHLPKKGRVLDAGGGPGRYSIALAKMGYNVTLLDLVPEHLEIAKKQIKKAGVRSQIEEVTEGSITDLSRFKSNHFDAVICLGGPLSHVAPESERKSAVSELIRVGREKAPIFVSVMGKYGLLLATAFGWPDEVGLKKHFKRIVEQGDDYMWRGDGFSHFFTLNELEEMFSSRKVQILDKVGLEGLNIEAISTNNFAKKHPLAWKNWLSIHRRMCTNPVVVDLSAHMMIIVQKK